jgi:hypothetical protein
MGIELDHVFVCTAQGAPEGDELVRFGLREGQPNRHPGQGTANRRFAFANAMIELFWVCDPQEAQSEVSRRTLLWERWSGREGKASPFGICLRPVGSQDTVPPFPAWEYRPSYLPDQLAVQIGDTSVEEPMWVYLSFMSRAYREQEFIEHPIGIRKITGLTVTTIRPVSSSVSQTVVENGVLSTRTGPEHLLEVHFDGNRRNETVDFRPHLPIIFRL